MHNAFGHQNTTCNIFLNSSKLQQYALLEQKLRSSAVSCLNFACLMKFLADFFKKKNVTILSYISSKIHFLKPFYCVTIDIWAVPLMISSRLDFESEHIIIKCENIILQNFLLISIHTTHI